MEKPAKLETPLTQMFNMDYPIVGAPMFLVSSEEMVKAASMAGGMGSFPALNYRPIENFESTVQRLMSDLDGKPFAINIIVQKKNDTQIRQAEIAIREEVPLIITSLGNPKSIIEMAKGSKTKIFCDVVGLTHAKKVQDLGADGLVAVGTGAGGHAGELSLFALLPLLRQKINLPMIAGGCMNDGRSLLAAMALGADGIYMGTRLIASKEAKVDAEYKDAILSARCEDIINTDRVDGFPGNFILTENLKKVLRPNFVDNFMGQHPALKRTISLLRARRALFGSPEQKLSYKNTYSAGQGVGLIDDLPSIQDIFWNTMKTYQERVKEIK